VETLSSVDLSAFPDSRYATLLRSRAWLMRFPKDIERRFDEFHLGRIRGRVRAFFLLWPMMELYRLADAMLTSRMEVFSWWNIPSLLFVAGGSCLLWSRWYWRAYVPSATLLAAVVAALVSYTLPTDYPGSGELQGLKFGLNVPVLSFLLLGLPFYRASAITIGCAAIYAAVTVQLDLSAANMVSNIAAVGAETAMAVLLAHAADRSSRTSFLQEQLLAEIAARDGMTGLQNRAALDAHLDLLWKQAQRNSGPIGLLLFDVDHFKGFNDTRGHQAGDACLRQVASILKGYARRPMDMAARYGGEEFALVLFQTQPEHVLAIAEAIRTAVEALGEANPAAPRKIVTVSCGMAVVMPAAGRSVHGLVQLADEALYEAKENGRNCVHRAPREYTEMETGRFYRRSHLRVIR
jgi:diguanylate cyclase (GGDEF)-like protein